MFCGPKYLLAALVATASLSAAQGQEPQPGDAEHAYQALRSKALDGDPNAKFDAFMLVYEQQPRLDRYVPEALEFLQQSARAGMPGAQHNLGFAYWSGLWVEKDDALALDWLSRGAQQGLPSSQLLAGVIHSRVSVDTGSEEDFALAEQWFRRVIANPESTPEQALDASDRLGLILIYGNPASDEGWSLIKGAAEAGYQPAVDSLLELRSMLEGLREEGYEEAVDLLADLESFLVTLESR